MVLTAVLAPAAAFFVGVADGYPAAARDDAKPAVSDTGLCCLEIVAAAPIGLSSQLSNGMHFTAVEFASASRYRIDSRSRYLPVGVASEQGLQVRTILVARSVSATFPEIQQISGVRPDALRWHPNGLALDVMVPNPGSDEGIALGNEIVAFVLENATRFGMQDAIWRGTYYTPDGGRTSGYGHYDHIHITTTGGGYPTGEEMYVR